MRFPFVKWPHRVRAAFLLSIFLGWAGGARAATLADVWAAADSLSPDLARARTELSQARADYAQARGFENPVLFGEREQLSDGVTDDTEWTYGLRQELGGLWSYAPRRAAARLAYAAAVADYAETRAQVFVALAGEALTLAALGREAALLDSVLGHAARAVAAMEARYQKGDVAEYEWRRLAAARLVLLEEQAGLESTKQEAAREFAALSGLPASAAEGLALPEPAPLAFLTADEVAAAARHHRPRVVAAEAALGAAAKQVAASRWNQLPGLAVGLGRKTAGPDFEGVAFEAELELPLFTQRRGERQRAHAAWEQARLDLAAARLAVDAEARAAFSRWQALARDSAHRAFPATQAARDLQRGVQMYLAGELSPVELVDVLESTRAAEAAATRLRHRRIVAALELRRVAGLPLVESR